MQGIFQIQGSARAFCAVKTCAVRPVFTHVVGELQAADPSSCPGGIKQNANSGEQSEAPRRSWKPGPEQRPGPENEDSQHMLNQPKGSFPERSGRSGNACEFESFFCLFGSFLWRLGCGGSRRIER